MSTQASPRRASRPISQIPLVLRGRDIWHRSAPAPVVEAGRWHEACDGWNLWRAHLRRRPRRIEQVMSRGARDWLQWSHFGDGAESLKRLDARLKKRSARKRHRQWVRQQIADLFARLARWPAQGDQALECLAWAYALPRLSGVLDAETWWHLLDRLMEIAADADVLPRQELPLVQQLLSGELRLTIAYLFPELKPCRRLAPPAVKAIAGALQELISAEGAIHATQLDQFGPLLGCWTRSALISGRLKRAAWPAASQKRLARCVERARQLLTADRRQVLSNQSPARWPRSLLRAAPQAIRRLRTEPAGQIRPITEHAAEPAFQSDAAEYAVLRTDWSAGTTILAIDHSLPEVRLEFWLAGEPMLWGNWKCEIKTDGQRREILKDWEAVCWVSDEDMIYLELQAPFAGEVKVQRQMLVGRAAPILFLNDVILPRTRTEIEYASSLPLYHHVTCKPAHETREMKLVGRTRQALLMPLELGEWRQDASAGRLAVRGNLIELSMAANARAMAAPWFFDLKQTKSDKAFTWRRLTVGENRQVVPRDEAVGYRVQIGRRQYLFYRSLATRGVRTVLGAHTASEFLASRIADDGELETMIEIE